MFMCILCKCVHLANEDLCMRPSHVMLLLYRVLKEAQVNRGRMGSQECL